MQVHLGRAFLQDAKGSDNGCGHAIGVPGDVEVLHGALRLRRPQLIGWDFDDSLGISLLPVLKISALSTLASPLAIHLS